MKHQIKDGDRLIATIETYGSTVVVIHEPQPEVKPVQFEKKTSVECTPEQRKEIIRVAKEYGREIYGDTETCGDRYPNLVWDSRCNHLLATYATPTDDPHRHWIPFDEFVARLKGEFVEPIECTIPFDIERFRSGDFVRVETRDGREVTQLTEFHCTATPVVGIIKGHNGVSWWYENGSNGVSWWYENGSNGEDCQERSIDLMLVVKGGGE